MANQRPLSVHSTKDKTAVKNRELLKNRKAFHDYFVLSSYEAGVVLVGTEVKSCRTGKIALQDSYARILNGEVLLFNAHINQYEMGNRFNHEPVRVRKLLLKKSEIRKMAMAVKEKGLTLIPLRFYLKNGRVKVEIGVCKGKINSDKRETLKKKQQDIETRRAIARVNCK